jgi:homoserine kinase
MAAYKCAKKYGAAALSGAGPSIIVFTQPSQAQQAITEIRSVFEERGIKTRGIITRPNNRGVHRI